MKKEYINKGICIWCLKGKPDGKTFKNRPHIITRQVGNTNVGFDICDECNFYFGTSGKIDQFTVSPEIAFAEIVNSINFLAKPSKNELSYLELQAKYFRYYHATGILELKKAFQVRPNFVKDFTRQFKRGIYEAFLQEYHFITTQGLDSAFKKVRNFARWNMGDLPVYFLKINSNPSPTIKPTWPAPILTEHSLAHINEFGFCQLEVPGYIFFLEATPNAASTRNSYLKKEYQKLAVSKMSVGKIMRMDTIIGLGFTRRTLTPKIRRS
ncbi:hypothetical protein [Rufibacter tibetensis]|nr:hypothetical protein [Rufibacter tibetensis]